MNCIKCDHELTNGVDTYGDIGAEMCWDCWSESGDDPNGDMGYIYGLGPHLHAFDADGNIIIGGTTFLDPAGEPDEYGLYHLDVSQTAGAVYSLYYPLGGEDAGMGLWFRDMKAFHKYAGNDLASNGLE